MNPQNGLSGFIANPVPQTAALCVSVSVAKLIALRNFKLDDIDIVGLAGFN
jgi:hypothetical protein